MSSERCAAGRKQGQQSPPGPSVCGLGLGLSQARDPQGAGLGPSRGSGTDPHGCRKAGLWSVASSSSPVLSLGDLTQQWVDSPAAWDTLPLFSP